MSLTLTSGPDGRLHPPETGNKRLDMGPTGPSSREFEWILLLNSAFPKTLNTLARSPQDPMPALGISHDGWNHWRELLTGSTRRALLSDSARSKLDDSLGKVWNSTFPSDPIISKYLVSRVKGMVETLIKADYEANATGGIALRLNPEAYHKLAL